MKTYKREQITLVDDTLFEKGDVIAVHHSGKSSEIGIITRDEIPADNGMVWTYWPSSGRILRECKTQFKHIGSSAEFIFPLNSCYESSWNLRNIFETFFLHDKIADEKDFQEFQKFESLVNGEYEISKVLGHEMTFQDIYDEVLNYCYMLNYSAEEIKEICEVINC